MQLGDFTIIAVEERNEVFRQVALIFFVQRPHDTAVDPDVLGVLRMVVANKNIAWMHVCVEKAVAEHLGEKDLHAAFRQQLHVRALRFQRLHVGNRDPVNPLHDHHVFATVIGVDLRYI